MKIKRCFAAIILLSFFMVSCTVSSGKSEQNKRFCYDIVRVLSKIYENRIDSTQEFYEKAYAMKQGVEDARLIMKPWRDDPDTIRKRTIDYIDSGLKDLQTVTDILLKSSFPLDEKRGTEFKTKLEVGLQKLYEASLIAMHPKTGLNMSKADKDEIADFTKRVFKEQLSEFSEKIKNDSQYKVAWEIYAAAVMAGEFPK
jgi:hypothetical protein